MKKKLVSSLLCEYIFSFLKFVFSYVKTLIFIQESVMIQTDILISASIDLTMDLFNYFSVDITTIYSMI